MSQDRLFEMKRAEKQGEVDQDGNTATIRYELQWKDGSTSEKTFELKYVSDRWCVAF